MSNLEFNERSKNVSNSAKKVRRSGKVPGVLYGRKINNLLFEVGELELAHEMAVNGEYGVLEFDINGENHRGLIKEVQRDPVTHKVIHLDIEELRDKEKIVSSIPIHYIGEDYINKKGVVLQKEKDSVKVECLLDNLPKAVEFNVSTGNAGDVYKFGDLEIASEISILDDLNSVIASISYERKKVSDDMDIVSEVVNSNDE